MDVVTSVGVAIGVGGASTNRFSSDCGTSNMGATFSSSGASICTDDGWWLPPSAGVSGVDGGSAHQVNSDFGTCLQ